MTREKESYKIASYKVFSGRRYFYYSSASNKRQAEKIAKEARGKGGLARVVSIPLLHIPYVVYARLGGKG